MNVLYVFTRQGENGEQGWLGHPGIKGAMVCVHHFIDLFPLATFMLFLAVQFHTLYPACVLVLQGTRGQTGAKGEEGTRGVTVSHLRVFYEK